ncbi:TPA: DUF3850 domain-containing protein [Enterococcus faecalis]|uniref:DUF3850 domain-containing protein n=1 Tax=Enterococcus sp. DIV0086 TaxID=2774655 RepID=UPI002986F910|nr:DUF3850 domain-containing protein [Enterococcus faecalis]HBI1662536.1 DUF3850 domain-containing protein [Enterococcus faecalis]HBI1677699.1 DUF3850 domain-containing protein [Enterococcus faecalis]HBI1678251.1 DUF3850 domain-containing protein [Enterococcus faecalis]HBI1686287.1 DUF3850 domain-containing protein [Enterococcus faecalis]
MEHKLKIDTEYFEAVLNEKKNFEIRFNDRNFQIEDIVILQEITENREYTGREITATISYITDFEQKEGFVVFGFKKLK